MRIYLGYISLFANLQKMSKSVNVFAIEEVRGDILYVENRCWKSHDTVYLNSKTKERCQITVEDREQSTRIYNTLSTHCMYTYCTVYSVQNYCKPQHLQFLDGPDTEPRSTQQVQVLITWLTPSTTRMQLMGDGGEGSSAYSSLEMVTTYSSHQQKNTKQKAFVFSKKREHPIRYCRVKKIGS